MGDLQTGARRLDSQLLRKGGRTVQIREAPGVVSHADTRQSPGRGVFRVVRVALMAHAIEGGLNEPVNDCALNRYMQRNSTIFRVCERL